MEPNDKSKDWILENGSGKVSVEYRATPPNFLIMVFVGAIGLIFFFFMLFGGFFDILGELKSQLFNAKETGIEGWLSLLPLLFFLPFALWPMIGIYAVGAGLLNHYKVTANSQGLHSSYGPFPWPGAVHLPKEKILQLFCRPDNGNPSLKVLTTGGRTKILLPCAPSMEKAWEAEQAIETMLGIRDQEVRGETADPKAYKTGDKALWIPPKGMKLTQADGNLELTFSGEKVAGIFMLPFSLLWTGIIATMFGLLNLNQIEGKMPLAINLMIMVFLLIGLGMLYFALSTLINKHTLSITPAGISYKIGPLPARGGQSLSATGFAGARRETSTHRTSKGGTYTIHKVYIDYQDGRQINLCGSLLGMEAGDLVVQAAKDILGGGQR